MTEIYIFAPAVWLASFLIACVLIATGIYR